MSKTDECGWNSTSGTTVALTFSGARCANRIGTDIGVGPTVKRTLLDASEIIGRKIVAKPVALLNPGVEFSRSRVECEGSRIAHSRGKRRLAGAVWLEP